MAFPTSSEERSAQESRQEFDKRMLNLVSELERTRSSFFSRRVTKSMATQVVQGQFAYALELPRKFFTKHGDEMECQLTFRTADHHQAWPIMLTVRSYLDKPPRVFAFGDGGWKAFLTENRIKVGDFLIFKLVQFSDFKVFIGRAPEEVTQRVPEEAPAGVGDSHHPRSELGTWRQNPSPWWNVEQAPKSCRVCKVAPPCPRFLATIHPPSNPQQRLSSLAVPGRFWECYGRLLECDELQLRGPDKAIYVVKAKRTHLEKQRKLSKLSVRLESGWGAFVVANQLQVGDILEFFLVGSSCFTVDLLERVVKC